MLKNDSVKELIQFCKALYNSEKPNDKFLNFEGTIPKSIYNKIQYQFCPEPFYGYIDEDMSNDALLLLINPGEVSEDKYNNEEKVKQYNFFHKDRYLNWTSKEYYEENNRTHEINKNGHMFREKIRKQINNIIKYDNEIEEVENVHTMELFPFHSKKFNFASKENMKWIFNLKTSELIMNAIKEIAENKKTKYIFGIGIQWISFFSHFGYEPIEVKFTKNPENNKYRQRLYKFKFGDSTPIIISISEAGAINLPRDSKYVEQIRRMLDFKI